MKKKSLFALITSMMLVTLIIAACAPRSSTQAPGLDVYSNKGGAPAVAPMPAAMPAAPAATMAPMMEQAQAYDASGNPLPEQRRLVIENADLTIVVDEPADRTDRHCKTGRRYGWICGHLQLYKARTERVWKYPQGQSPSACRPKSWMKPWRRSRA